MVTASEIAIDTDVTSMDLANSMFGSGVTVHSATYSGDDDSSGIYTGGDTTSPGVVPSDAGVILSTGKAKEFTNESGATNQSAGNSGRMDGVDGDSDMNAVAGQSTFDAALFEAEFTPEGDTLTMQIVFSSDEYLEYVNSGFNDAVGIWVNGEQAELTIGTGEVSIDNINDTSNSNLYVDNADGAYNTEMDGFTITLTLKAPVNAGEVNTIKIGIADAGDDVWDSNLLIVGDSIQTAVIAGDDEAEIDRFDNQTLDVLANDSDTDGGTLTITHLNGVAVVAGDSVTLPSGEIIQLNVDGTITVTTDGDPGENVFSYSVSDDDGNTDTAFVTIDTLPCFTKGVAIKTDHGDILIEDLEVGDLVETLDNGMQPIRWIGCQTVVPVGKLAPVTVAANTFGHHRQLTVSPQHRILLSGRSAALLFGQDEILVAAKDLVNGKTIRVLPVDANVTYYHLLFQHHEIVLSNGLYSESFHPGPEVFNSMDHATRQELQAIFPHLDSETGLGYGPAARLSLKSFEARTLRASGGY